MNGLVDTRSGTLITNSFIVSEGTQSQHASVIRLVRDNLQDFEEFGGVGFEIEPFETAGGTQNRTVAVLNREHAMLLMTYMRNTEIVRDFKKRLIKAFIELENAMSSPALPQDYATALRELASTVEAKEIAEKQEREQRQLAEQRARAIEAQAPAVAKANAHTASKTAIGRQEFAREVQFWGKQRGLNINQESVFELLRRKGMLISGQRKDRNHPTSQAVKNGWAEVEKGTAETGYVWSKPVIKPKGQDIAWKWILSAVEDFGQQLNPSKEIAS